MAGDVSAASPRRVTSAGADVRQLRTAVVVRAPVPEDARLGSTREIEIQAVPGEPDAYELVLEDDKHTPCALRPSAVYGHHARSADLLCATEVEPLLRAALEGESGAIIAYGQTGSGKSYTMGTEALRAEAPWRNSVGQYVPRRLFQLAAEQSLQLTGVECAMVEVYRENRAEQVFDLLSAGRRRVELGDPAIWHPAGGWAWVEHKRPGSEGRVHVVRGRVMLVDLAGSERAAAAALGSTTQRQGAGINLGLHYLGLVIEELASRGQTLHYSNTTLTRILKPALGGGGSNGVLGPCNTLMLGCVAPLALHAHRTRDTLDFLAKARGQGRRGPGAEVPGCRGWEQRCRVGGKRSSFPPEATTRADSQLKLRCMRASVLPVDAAPPLMRHAAFRPPAQAGTVKNSVSADVTALRAARLAGTDGAATAALEEELERLRQENRALTAELAALRRQGAGGGGAAADGGAVGAGGAAPAGTGVQLSRDEYDALQRQMADLRISVAREHGRAEAQEVLVKQLMMVPPEGGTGGPALGEEDAVVADSMAPAALGPALGGDVTPTRRLSVFNAAAALTTMQATPVLSAAEAVSELAAGALAAGERGLDVEAICVTGSSNLSAVQLAMLEGLVQRKLQVAAAAAAEGGAGASAAGGAAPGEAVAAAADALLPPAAAATLRGVLARLEREVECLLLAVHAYNETLGEAQAALANAQEDLAAALKMKEEEFEQLVQEKMHYLRVASAMEGALNQSQEELRQLEERYREAREALDHHLQAAHSPPGRLGTIGRLFGLSPSPGGDGGPPHGGERRGSHSGGSSRSGSPSPGSPVAARRQQQRGAFSSSEGGPASAAASPPMAIQVQSRLQRESRQPPQPRGGDVAGPPASLPTSVSQQQQQQQQQSQPSPAGSPMSLGSPAPACAADAAMAVDAHPAPDQPALGLARGGAAAGASPPAPEPEPPLPCPLGPAGSLPTEVMVVLPPRGAQPHKAALLLPDEGRVRLEDGSTQEVAAWAGGSPAWREEVALAMCRSAETGLPLPSGISLAAWAARRMLRPGLCHFCCAAPPAPGVRYRQLELCRGCWELLEPANWKAEECVYRFTSDDLRQMDASPTWLCPKCQPRGGAALPLVLQFALAPPPPTPGAAGASESEEEVGGGRSSRSGNARAGAAAGAAAGGKDPAPSAAADSGGTAGDNGGAREVAGTSRERRAAGRARPAAATAAQGSGVSGRARAGGRRHEVTWAPDTPGDIAVVLDSSSPSGSDETSSSSSGSSSSSDDGSDSDFCPTGQRPAPRQQPQGAEQAGKRPPPKQRQQRAAQAEQRQATQPHTAPPAAAAQAPASTGGAVAPGPRAARDSGQPAIAASGGAPAAAAAGSGGGGGSSGRFRGGGRRLLKNASVESPSAGDGEWAPPRGASGRPATGRQNVSANARSLGLGGGGGAAAGRQHLLFGAGAPKPRR
eukprot:scaffold9.g3274.t1